MHAKWTGYKIDNNNNNNNNNNNFSYDRITTRSQF